VRGRYTTIVLGLLLSVPASGMAQAPPSKPAMNLLDTLGRGMAQAPPSEPGRAAPATVPGEPPLAEDEALVLNFERAEIREVIHSLATALGLSYSIDPAIEGQVTIRTTGRIPRKELFPLFNRILRNNGIVAVKQGEVYQIVPIEEGKGRAPLETSAARRTLLEDGFVIEIIASRHVAAEEMANILQPFITPGGEIFAYPRANVVVITELGSNVDRLRELAAAFDVDGFRYMKARVFELKEGDPEELANELLTLLAPYGVSGTGDGTGGLFLIPVYRLNAIVAFAMDPSAFDEIERWLTLLDIPPDKGSGRQTYVYHVENAKAADLAAVLTELFGGEGGGPGAGLARNPRGTPAGVGLFGAGGVSGRRGSPTSRAARGNRGGLGGGRATAGRQRTTGIGGRQRTGIGGRAGGGIGGGGIGGIGGVGGGGRAGGGPGGGGLTQPGGAAGAAGGAGVLGVSLPGGQAAAQQGAVPGQPTGPPPIFKQEVRIVADEVTNSLVVLATRRDYQLILDILRRLDVVPRQVVLEVMIAEVSLGKGLEFGLSYAYSSGNLGPVVPGIDDPDDEDGDGGTTGGSLFGAVEDIAGLVGSAAGQPTFPPGGAFAVLDASNDFRIFLRALQTRTNVKILSAPHIIAADNREAAIQVGESIPILTQSSQSTLATANIVNSVQYRDTGKILTVLPQVNSKGLVNLQIRQEVSDVGEEEFGATGSPSFTTREVETTLVVENGETVLIGGIIDDRVDHLRRGVPYLMDIPVLGRAFRDESDSVTRTELLITITPFVIRTKEEARFVTDDFSSRVEGIQQLRDAMHQQYDRFKSRQLQYEDLDPLEGVPVDRR
jgi:general secretion pathway protein D